MLLNPSTSFSKKAQYQCSSMSNLLMRTDGFKKIVKGLSYKKPSGTTIIRSSQNVHTSMGKRPTATLMQYQIGKQIQKDDDGMHNQKIHQFRRTKTADYLRGNRKVVQNREKLFLQTEKIQNDCFKNICQQLGI